MALTNQITSLRNTILNAQSLLSDIQIFLNQMTPVATAGEFADVGNQAAFLQSQAGDPTEAQTELTGLTEQQTAAQTELTSLCPGTTI